MNFSGIDVHKDSLNISVLNENLNLIYNNEIFLKEIINIVEKYQPLYIGIDSPNGLNKGYMNNEKFRKKLGLKNNKYHYNKKVSEFYLNKLGFRLYNTPSKLNELGNFKSWMLSGLNLYKVINKLGYKDLNKKVNNKGVAEVFPHASFGILNGKKLKSKRKKEGIMQRINLCKNLSIKNLDQYLKGSLKKKSDILDSTIAAFTVYKLFIDDYKFIGNKNENKLLLPKRKLNNKY